MSNKTTANLTKKQKRQQIHPASHEVEVRLTNGQSIKIKLATACVQKDFVQLGSDWNTNPVFNKNIKRADVRSERAERFAAKYK